MEEITDILVENLETTTANPIPAPAEAIAPVAPPAPVVAATPSTPAAVATAPKGLDTAKIAGNRTAAKRDFVEKGRKITQFSADGVVTANGVEVRKYSFRVEGINYRFTILHNSIKGLPSRPELMNGATVDFGGVYTTSGDNTFANIRSLEVMKLAKLAQLGAYGISLNATADLFD